MSSSLHNMSRFTPSSTGHKAQTVTEEVKRRTSRGSSVAPPNVGASLSGSETDVSTSTENLSQEERYVIKHTARQEPQGQEKQEQSDGGLLPHAPRQHSLDNASSYNTLIIHATGEDGLDPWASLSPSRLSSLRDSYISATSSHSKTTSFPSSSPSSSPTLSGGVPSAPHSGTGTTSQQQAQQLRDITEIPDDYLSQSHVLKHLAKEVKVVSTDYLVKDGDMEGYETNSPPRRLLLLDLSSTDTPSRLHRYSTPVQAALRQSKLAVSRSQPDLTQLEGASTVQRPRTRGRTAELAWPTTDLINLLAKENASLKAELEACYRKVAKSQKLEHEISNIHQSHQELMQSSDRREKLERTARQKLQEENRILRQQYEILLGQLESPTSGATDEALVLRREIGRRDAMLAQLMAQNKELTGCRERQEIELAAQRATLQEQRTHIDILDTALTNAQANVMRLEEECRKRQIYEERVVQLQQSLSSLQLAREQLEGEINDLRVSRRVNNAAAQTAPLQQTMQADIKGESDDKQGNVSETLELRSRLRDRDERLMGLESEVTRWQQWYLEENAMRQAVIDAASIPRDAKIAALEQTSQESERLISEARSDKIRQMDELHAAQRRMADMENRARELESRLAEKEAMIKVLQAAHHHHHSSLLPSTSSPLHHHASSSGSSYHRQPSPASIGGGISNTSMLSSLTSGAGSGLTGDLGVTSSGSTAGVSSPPSLSSYTRSFANMRATQAGLSYGRPDYGSSSTPSAGVTGKSSSTYDQEGNKTLDDQLQQLDSQLLSGRALCCFSGFYNRGVTTRKEGLSQPLLVGLKRRPAIKQSQDDSSLSQIKYKRIPTQSQSLSDDGIVKLPPTPPPNTKDSKDSSVLYMTGRYNAKSASPTSKQFLSRYSPGSLPPTPPPNKDNNDMYYLRYNKSSLPPTPPSSSKDSNYFRYNSPPQDKDVYYRYMSNSNPSSLPPTPPPGSDKDPVDRYFKSSSLYSESSKANHEILLLEKQGRTSQKQRRSSAGSQASSDDMNPRSAIPRPQPRKSSSSASSRGGYNRLEESTSKESLSSTTNATTNNSVASKLRLFQQSRKLTPTQNMSSREQLSAGIKYRIQL